MSAKAEIFNQLKKLIWEMQESGLLHTVRIRNFKGSAYERHIRLYSDDIVKTQTAMLAVVDISPDMVASKARRELDKNLKALAKNHGMKVFKRTKATEEIVPFLLNKRVLSAQQAILIQKFYSLLSDPVHGEDVCSQFAHELIDRIPELLVFLQAKKLVNHT